MSDDNQITEDELEGQNAEALPEREAMSVMPLPGDTLGPPPLDDAAHEPLRGGEEL